MRIDKFTQKMQEALPAAQDLAAQSNHQEITNEHFLAALLDQTDGVTRPLLEKIGVNDGGLLGALTQGLARRPKFPGGTYEPRNRNDRRAASDPGAQEPE